MIDFYAAQASVAIPGIPQLDPTRALDGERRIQCLKTLPASSEGYEFEWRAKVLGVYDKGSVGSVVETEYVLMDVKSNEIYSRLSGSGVFVGQGGWGGPRNSSGILAISPAGAQQGHPTAIYETRVPSTAAHLYRYVVIFIYLDFAYCHRLNGDYNPLHATPEPGIALGTGGVIMHGLYTWNVTAHLLIQKQADSNPAALIDFGARFRAPVKPGDTLVTEVWDIGSSHSGSRDIRFQVKHGSTVVLSNGRALIVNPNSRL